ncbi:hypothetical protein MELB17_09653 [Marinobacter sp. ELB17]|nr:hypothetical protein MELB17_09653 [Marinobacter sp. ELB17]
MLVECKASRSDFLADRNKPFRLDPDLGMGIYRFYLCLPGVIGVADLPDGWGLLYAEGEKIRRIAGPKGNSWGHDDNKAFINPRNSDAEITMLVSVMRRLR